MKISFCIDKKYPINKLERQCVGHATTIQVTRMKGSVPECTRNIGALWDAYNTIRKVRLTDTTKAKRLVAVISDQENKIQELRVSYSKLLYRSNETARMLQNMEKHAGEQRQLAEVQAVEITMLKEELDSMRTDFAKVGANQQRLIKEK